MSLWRCSVEELQVRRRQLVECERAQKALSEVTSCFQQLASSLGSASDGSFLREELEETRGLAHRICSGLSRRLLCLLSDSDSAPSCLEEQDAAERLWVVFLSALENFLLDLHKMSHLIGQFPLRQRYDRRSLVHTGSCDSVAGVAARAASVQTPWISLEEEPRPDLTNHIVGLEALLQDIQVKVCIPLWAVEATQQAWAELQDGNMDASMDDMMEDLMEASSHSNKTTSCCRMGCMLCLLC